jgi:hypothetical protein
MDPNERQELIARLEGGRAAFLDAVAGLAEADAARPPAPDRWSVLQCAEHVAIAEQYLYDRLLEGRPAEGPAVPPRREAKIRDRADDRSRAVAAPEPAVPRGRYATLSEAVAAFVASRARTIAYVETCDEDLRAKHTTHPILKVATCQETLLMMAAHPLRHAKQVAEIRAALEASEPRP